MSCFLRKLAGCMDRSTHIVIMAGGIGSRFWPLSTPEFPKQFIDILGCGRSLIQLTFDRFRGVCPPENVWVVTNAAYVNTVREQLPDVPAGHILAEPAARNTAPCIAWACWEIKRCDPDANVVVTPSDAFVADPVEFRRVISAALDFTRKNDAIVTVGISPSRPETGYGYVQCGEKVSGEILKVERFREKPDRATAEKYLSEGGFLWNAGIFVWNLKTVEAALRKYRTDLAGMMDRIISEGDISGLFPLCEKISIDYAVMEPAAAEGRVFTIPADFGWSDLGNWASLHDRLTADGSGNAAVGNVSFVECRDCVVHAEDAVKVVLQGLEGYIVSEKNGRILVCRREEEQRIKDFSNI